MRVEVKAELRYVDDGTGASLRTETLHGRVAPDAGAPSDDADDDDEEEEDRPRRRTPRRPRR
jgi:hypothetical protein